MSQGVLNHDVIIVAPHPDDEIIGCCEILFDKSIKPIIIYGTKDRQEEVMSLKKFNDIKVQIFQHSVPSQFLHVGNTFYFPDPIYEIHPLHRQWGAMGEEMARDGLDVIFYNTNMTAPYIHEMNNPKEKRRLLEKVYPSQKDLWKYDHKYSLFEGYNKWIMPR